LGSLQWKSCSRAQNPRVMWTWQIEKLLDLA
jgi:hypothetical protein